MASMATPMSRRLRVSFGPILASSAFPPFIESYRYFYSFFSISARVPLVACGHYESKSSPLNFPSVYSHDQ